VSHEDVHRFIFFCGTSIYLSTALLAHLLSYNITWGPTKKVVDGSDFFIEVRQILRQFWLAVLLSFLPILMMMILSSSLVPLEWRIPGNGNGNAWASILPLVLVSGCHVLFPFVLDPFLFSY
jgi:hypothetical protein